jgi:VanZ family protein
MATRKTMKKPPYRELGRQLFLYWLPLLAWLALIYWLSDRPKLPHPGRSVGVSDHLFDYTAHAFFFGLLTWLTWRVLACYAGRLPFRARLFPWLAALIAALYALLDEIHQAFVPGRYALLQDWLADLAGIVLVAGVLAVYQGMMWRKL